MTDNLQELEARLKHIEETTDKREVEEKLAEELKNYTGDDEVVSFKNIELEEVTVGFKSGLGSLDKLLGGFHEGNLIVVSGPTGQGKTTLLQTFTIALSKQNIKSLWFSYEVKIQNLIQNFGNELPDGYVPKILRDNSAIWIERKIVEAIVKYGVKAVFIDPFNSLTRFSSPRLSQELGDLSEKLKQMALKYNLLLFVSAHARRLNPEETFYSEETIRDTALLGNKADTVITLWRNKVKQKKNEEKQNGAIFSNESTVSLVKNRHSGMLGFFKVMHQGNKFVLTEWERSIEELEEQAIEEDVVTF